MTDEPLAPGTHISFVAEPDGLVHDIKPHATMFDAAREAKRLYRERSSFAAWGVVAYDYGRSGGIAVHVSQRVRNVPTS